MAIGDPLVRRQKNMLKSKCVVCGSDILDYHIRKVCSPECQSKNMRGDKNPAYVGGIAIYTNGKKRIKSYSQRFIRGQKRKICEARNIVEQIYGKLPKGTQIHHVNGNSLDNTKGNLLVCTTSYHRWLHEEMARRYMNEHFN